MSIHYFCTYGEKPVFIRVSSLGRNEESRKVLEIYFSVFLCKDIGNKRKEVDI